MKNKSKFRSNPKLKSMDQNREILQSQIGPGMEISRHEVEFKGLNL